MSPRQRENRRGFKVLRDDRQTWTAESVSELVAGDRYLVRDSDGIGIPVLVRGDGSLTIETRHAVPVGLFVGLSAARRVPRGLPQGSPADDPA